MESGAASSQDAAASRPQRGLVADALRITTGGRPGQAWPQTRAVRPRESAGRVGRRRNGKASSAARLPFVSIFDSITTADEELPHSAPAGRLHRNER